MWACLPKFSEVANMDELEAREVRAKEKFWQGDVAGRHVSGRVQLMCCMFSSTITYLALFGAGEKNIWMKASLP